MKQSLHSDHIRKLSTPEQHELLQQAYDEVLELMHKFNHRKHSFFHAALKNAHHKQANAIRQFIQTHF
jgi:hypothetical protein